MGDLIALKRSTEPMRGMAPPAGGAAILFFTGVRYYRMPDPTPPQPPARRRRATRSQAADMQVVDSRVADTKVGRKAKVAAEAMDRKAMKVADPLLSA